MKKQIRPVAARRSDKYLHPFSSTILTGLVVLALSGLVQAQSFSPHLTGPYERVPGKFFVRLYVVYCQTAGDAWADQTGAAELHRRTVRTFAMLNTAFSPHNIHFVPGESEPGSCHSVYTR